VVNLALFAKFLRVSADNGSRFAKPDEDLDLFEGGLTMEETIGNAAGQIWTLLADAEKPIKISDLPKLCKLKSQVAYQALGWLAREEKIAYFEDGSKKCVRLAVEESRQGA